MKNRLVIFLFGAPMAAAALIANVYPEVRAKDSIIADGKTSTLDYVFAQRVKTFRKTGASFYFPSFIPARYSLSSIKFDSEGDPQHQSRRSTNDKSNH